MDYEKLAARCVIAGIQGPTPTPDELDLVRRGIAGVILFKRNVIDPAQVAELSRALKAAAPGALLISVDQDFAPVLDVDTNPDNPVIGDRSFGRDPARVARLGVALGKGLESGRVASCGKHFPGHGDTSQDSHLTLPRLAHDRERLWQVELVPFVAAARAGLASVMTAHIRFEAFDRLPATLSPEAMKLLREDVAFQGACISDDLEMKAIADTYGVVDGAELAIAAGADAVLVCHSLKLQHDSIESIARGADAGPLARERLAEAAARMEKLLQFARPTSAIDPSTAAAHCGTKEHRAFVAQLFAPPAVAAQRDPTEWRRA